jgi:hypothetical protein
VRLGVIDDLNGDCNNHDKLRTNHVGPNVLGTLADWLTARLSARTR